MEFFIKYAPTERFTAAINEKRIKYIDTRKLLQIHLAGEALGFTVSADILGEQEASINLGGVQLHYTGVPLVPIPDEARVSTTPIYPDYSETTATVTSGMRLAFEQTIAFSENTFVKSDGNLVGAYFCRGACNGREMGVGPDKTKVQERDMITFVTYFFLYEGLKAANSVKIGSE